jgi:hypothetical protein
LFALTDGARFCQRKSRLVPRFWNQPESTFLFPEDSMRRSWYLASAGAVALVVAVIAWLASTTGAQNPNNGNGAGNGKKAVEGPLPIRQVVLFNSGVGYFQREGDVDGNAHVELSFPTSDINDLLKSLVLQDLGGGKISTVSYDSHDPIDKILRSFALDLNNNPTFGQLLNQARGEKIELFVKSDKKDGQTSKIQGIIVGMEVKRRPIGKDQTQVVDMETLNISGPSGLQGVNMEDILGVRFQNPTLENEFQRALKVLASSHDTQKKTVSLGFNGAGKRAVRVGYVVERPLWKTSYRLRIEPNGKIFMQGWAMVENTSDDDWNDVRMVLVSGRPISYQMNLYEPIYIPRPLVEPEMFASLRPPVYGGAMGADEQAREPAQPRAANAPNAGPVAIGGVVTPQQALALQQQMMGPMGGAPGSFNPMQPGWGGQGFGGGNFQGGFQGNQFGLGNTANTMNPYQNNRGNVNYNNDGTANSMNIKLTYEELQRRRQQEVAQKDAAKAKGAMVAGLNFKEGIASVASAEEVGDYYQYVIDQKVSLSRQKSAMLPILDQTIDGSKISIFNEETQAKYPLLGLRLKNTSGQPLTQGPITVYDNHTYAGDTRILDLQPNEERLLSYALDQSTEVKTDVKSTPSPDMTFRLGEPNLTARYKLRQTKTYSIKNRSIHDRTVILEHPIRSDWKLVDQKPSEKTRSHYRFSVNVAAGKSATYDVVEEQARVDQVALGAVSGAPAYTVSVGVNVKPMVHVHEDRLVALKIQKGFVTPTWKSRETRSYHVQNLSEQDRTFTIDHIIRKDWSVIDPKEDPKAGPEVLRFKLAVAKGKTGTQEIVEERVHTEKGKLLKDVGETKLKEFIAHAVPSADVKAALTKAIALSTKVVDTAKQLGDSEKSLKVVSDDQARLRENLRIIPQTSDPYKKFLDKFVTQETEIEDLQKNIRQVQATLLAAQREYDVFIANLNAE